MYVKKRPPIHFLDYTFVFFFLVFCKLALLELSALTPDLGALNEQSLRLLLSSSEAEQLQVLNTRWVQVFTLTMTRHRCVLERRLINFRETF